MPFLLPCPLEANDKKKAQSCKHAESSGELLTAYTAQQGHAPEAPSIRGGCRPRVVMVSEGGRGRSEEGLKKDCIFVIL